MSSNSWHLENQIPSKLLWLACNWWEISRSLWNPLKAWELEMQPNLLQRGWSMQSDHGLLQVQNPTATLQGWQTTFDDKGSAESSLQKLKIWQQEQQWGQARAEVRSSQSSNVLRQHSERSKPNCKGFFWLWDWISMRTTLLVSKGQHVLSLCPCKSTTCRPCWSITIFGVPLGLECSLRRLVVCPWKQCFANWVTTHWGVFWGVTCWPFSWHHNQAHSMWCIQAHISFWWQLALPPCCTSTCSQRNDSPCSFEGEWCHAQWMSKEHDWTSHWRPLLHHCAFANETVGMPFHLWGVTSTTCVTTPASEEHESLPGIALASQHHEWGTHDPDFSTQEDPFLNHVGVMSPLQKHTPNEETFLVTFIHNFARLESPMAAPILPAAQNWGIPNWRIISATEQKKCDCDVKLEASEASCAALHIWWLEGQVPWISMTSQNADISEMRAFDDLFDSSQIWCAKRIWKDWQSTRAVINWCLLFVTSFKVCLRDVRKRSNVCHHLLIWVLMMPKPKHVLRVSLENQWNNVQDENLQHVCQFLSHHFVLPCVTTKLQWGVCWWREITICVRQNQSSSAHDFTICWTAKQFNFLSVIHSLASWVKSQTMLWHHRSHRQLWHWLSVARLARDWLDTSLFFATTFLRFTHRLKIMEMDSEKNCREQREWKNWTLPWSSLLPPEI